MASEAMKKNYVIIAGVVLLYWVISISMVFMNKYLLSFSKLVDVPIFVTWYQCIVSVGICVIMSQLSKIYPEYLSFPSDPHCNETLKNVAPLSFMFVAMIVSNNICLQYITVQFYNVGRCLSTVFNVIFTFFFLGQTTSIKCLMTCCLIMAGFLLGTDQESKSDKPLPWMGIIFGILASAFVALNAIFTKKVMHHVKDDPWILAYYNNLNASIIMIPFMIVMGEVSSLYRQWDVAFDLQYWCVMTLTGVCGFSIGYASALQIQYTSPLTHNVSGTAKAAFQTVIAVVANSDVKSVLWWFSNALVLGGSLAYSFIRRAEMEASSNKKSSVLPVTEKVPSDHGHTKMAKNITGIQK